jgi:hypothetical protein
MGCEFHSPGASPVRSLDASYFFPLPDLRQNALSSKPFAMEWNFADQCLFLDMLNADILRLAAEALADTFVDPFGEEPMVLNQDASGATAVGAGTRLVTCNSGCRSFNHGSGLQSVAPTVESADSDAAVEKSPGTLQRPVQLDGEWRHDTSII